MHNWTEDLSVSPHRDQRRLPQGARPRFEPGTYLAAGRSCGAPQWATPHPTELCHILLIYATPHWSTVRHTPLIYATPHWAMPHPTELCHTPLIYSTPHWATQHNFYNMEKSIVQHDLFTNCRCRYIFTVQGNQISEDTSYLARRWFSKWHHVLWLTRQAHTIKYLTSGRYGSGGSNNISH